MGLINTMKEMGNVFPHPFTNEYVKTMPRRVLTAEEEELSYAKYYDNEMTSIPQEDLDVVNQGPMNPKYALPIEQRTKLLDSGYFDVETGYCCMPNGKGYAATKVFMKGVTPEMLDWWFNWHPLEGLRYAIWCPVAHDSISAKTPDAHKDSSPVDMKYRNYGKTHYPVEGFDLKGKEKIEITFYSPEDVGMDTELFKEPNISSLYAAKVVKHAGPIQLPINVFHHCVRPVTGGVEYRSRYWLGYTINEKDEIVESKIPFPKHFMESMARNNCLHSLTEYNHLASILPSLYAEQKGAIN
ncbi:MAG: hypothetical protein ATN35_11260 [Epulopiscium sp. Nele67-Bin004]|nr:MAG: hypothetical protein ATN35_11260 [Epulopiscium sp. Nele67-Bin004]